MNDIGTHLSLAREPQCEHETQDHDLDRRAETARRELTASIHSLHYAASKLCALLCLLEQPARGARLEVAARNLELHAEYVAKMAFDVVLGAQTLAGVGIGQRALERTARGSATRHREGQQ